MLKSKTSSTLNTCLLKGIQKRCEEALCCGRVFEEARIKRVFIKRLHESVGLSMMTYCMAHENATRQNLTRYAASLTKL